MSNKKQQEAENAFLLCPQGWNDLEGFNVSMPIAEEYYWPASVIGP